MTNSNTGGRAFPRLWESGKVEEHQGMTLLDYFTGKALAGFDHHNSGDKKCIAKECYDLADAMLAEKHRREGKDER